jgi:GNAT superfamily N-acetyltransferase
LKAPRIRIATRADIPAMWRIRSAVTENVLRASALTDADVLREMTGRGRGWVSENAGGVAGFAIGNAGNGNVWALFVHPDSQGCGHGSALHDVVVRWLRESGPAVLWLTTGAHTRAATFYERRGWRRVGIDAEGEARYELSQ